MPKAIVDILTVFTLIEILSVSARSLPANRIAMRNLIDVTAAIVFREMCVGTLSMDLHWQEIVALAALVVALRGGVVLSSPCPSVPSRVLTSEPMRPA